MSVRNELKDAFSVSHLKNNILSLCDFIYLSNQKYKEKGRGEQARETLLRISACYRSERPKNRLPVLKEWAQGQL